MTPEYPDSATLTTPEAAWLVASREAGQVADVPAIGRVRTPFAAAARQT
jgi:hypothetical protein